MNIKFKSSKHCSSYEQLMYNPTDRKAIKKFNKLYNQTILSSSIKINQKLKSSPNAKLFNELSSKNKIELLSGVKDKDPLVLKVRIQDSYRKFFYFETTTSKYCLKKDWKGQFDKVCNIYVFLINKHDYSKVG